MDNWYQIKPVYVDPARRGYALGEKVDSPHLEWWPGDDLLQWDKGYLITTALKRRLEKTDLTGYDISQTTVETSETFDDEYPNVTPDVYLFEIVGEGCRDDFGSSRIYRDGNKRYVEAFIVSERGLEVIAEGDFDHVHEVECISEDDVFPSDLDLAGAIRLLFENPTDQNVAKVTTLLLDRDIPLHPDDKIDRKIGELSTLFVMEYELAEIVSLVERYDGNPPARGDAVSRLFALFESEHDDK